MIYTLVTVAALSVLVTSTPASYQASGSTSRNGVPIQSYNIQRRGGGFGNWGGFGPIVDNTCWSNQECFHDACCNNNLEAAAFCDSEAFNEVDSNCCDAFNQNVFIG